MQLELLAPAGNKDIGIAAITCGADAVYIAGPRFGARQAAGNTVDDIRELTGFAHRYGAKIYAVVNTILFDDELDAAQRQIADLAEAGVDAFIIQDLGILKMQLPSKPLFASTQAVIRTPEQAAALEALGFKRLILERQMSLDQIRAVRAATSCDLEFFVHGALCVSYSGQCYLSQKLTGRSANRGACIQACRSRYDLVDSNGNVLLKDKSILSLKDYRLDARIGDLIEAGISSFKIEGRLKNASYVKNVVRHYSNVLDDYIAKHPEHSRASFGHPVGGFTPDIDATFNRGYTEAFIDGTKGKWNSVDSAKSMGEYLGTIAAIEGNTITIDTRKRLSAGDGLAFINSSGEIDGMRVESAEGTRARLKSTKGLRRGEKVYRNLNTVLEKELERNMPQRLIGALIDYRTANGTTTVSARAEDGRTATIEFRDTAEPARNEATAESAIRTQLAKKSDLFDFSFGEFHSDRLLFYPAAQLNGWRRQLAQMLQEQPIPEASSIAGQKRGAATFPQKLTYLANCSNRLSQQVYRECGVREIAPAYELEAPRGAELIRTRYCIKHELGLCPKQHPSKTPSEPLFLENNGYKLKLEFDCKNCEMVVLL